jgi:hypothetical protein
MSSFQERFKGKYDKMPKDGINGLVVKNDQ